MGFFDSKKIREFGYILYALFWNVLSSWLMFSNEGTLEELEEKNEKENVDYYIEVEKPGGRQQLKHRQLETKDDYMTCTCGYNVAQKWDSEVEGSLIKIKSDFTNVPKDCVVIKTSYFSINFADVCLRWGLYGSANEYVGFPICPGFDISGEVIFAGSDVTDLRPGDKVFGCTFFGSYSTRIVIPHYQLRKIPSNYSMEMSAAISAVCFTAMHALALANYYPNRGGNFQNKKVLIHSAAGGVGSMLVALSHYYGAQKIVGIVGREEKIPQVKKILGAKSDEILEVQTKKSLWAENSPTDEKFSAVFDANGVETTQESYNHTAQGGRLIVFGAATVLPREARSLTILDWLKMGMNMSKMPKLDTMDMVMSSKSVLGFNLSFFTEETDMMSQYFDELLKIMNDINLNDIMKVEVLDRGQVRKAHDLLSSGNTSEKLIVKL